MSIFGSILEKLGIKKPAVAAPVKPAGPVAPPPRSGQMAPNGPPPAGFRPPVPPAGMPQAPAAMPMVDVVSKLDGLAKANPMQLDWKVSIVDLLALLGLDSSADAIKELAVELGCPASEMSDSYKRNVWLHKTVLQKIAENGGNIPQGLLHK